ncbi:MAG TPA: SCO family protein [Vicinamibacterales bacterium]|nr:SCO family protein [Vicinamibacterales bacterium]
MTSHAVVRTGMLGVMMLAASVVSAYAQMSAPLSVPPPTPSALQAIPILRDVGIDQKLDSAVPLTAPFVDENGHDVILGQYFGTRPVVLVLAYYECPMLCTQVINAVAASITAMNFDAGRQFDVLVVSFNPAETPSLAAGKRASFVKRYGRPGTDTGIHFLTGRQSSIDALTKAVGFRYAYDEKLGQYAHPAAITILTPQGHVSRYLFGIEFAPRDLKFALMDAADKKIGTIVDQAQLFCYHYDPATGRYGFAIITAVRVGGLLTIGALGTFIVVMLRRERRQASAVAPTATGTR